MCVVSFIGDHYNDKWEDLFKKIHPFIPPTTPFVPTVPYLPETGVPQSQEIIVSTSPITREEFDSLKKEVEEMKKLLIKAKAYDEKNNEPNCEMEEKVFILKEIAKLVGIDLSEVFGGDNISQK